MNAIKPKVKLYGIKPEMVLIHTIVVGIFNKHGVDCVITSGVGKKHSKRSLHYPGYALDFRIKHIDNESTIKDITRDLIEALPCCDVVLEHLFQPQSHLHVEYDPKDDDQFQEDKLYYKKHGKWLTN